MAIKTIKIQNFKSIRKAEIEMRPINILIGANGVGKSNFIGFLKFVSQIVAQKLQLHVAKNGRADNFLYFGRKKSEFLGGSIDFDDDFQNIILEKCPHFKAWTHEISTKFLK